MTDLKIDTKRFVTGAVENLEEAAHNKGISSGEIYYTSGMVFLAFHMGALTQKEFHALTSRIEALRA